MDRDLLQYAVVAVVAFATVLGSSAEQEIRPSDHGLAYQAASPPPAQNGGEKELRSFFGGGAAPPVQLPEAQNVSDAWRNARDEGRARGLGKDHVRLGLLVASAVCGLAGVVLLVVTGVVFLLRVQKRRGARGEKTTSTSAPTFVSR